MHTRRNFLFTLIIALLLVNSGCGGGPETPVAEYDSSIPAGAAENFVSTDANNDELILLETGHVNHAVAGVQPNGETLVVMTGGSENEIEKVYGGIWISAQGQYIVYFMGEDGLPNRAISQEHLALFTNYTETTVDVTLLKPDGSKEEYFGLPVNPEEIRFLRESQYTGKGTNGLAMELSIRSLSGQQALKMVSIGLGVFSCAATIASGGTLSLLFGIGCASSIYAIWTTSQPVEDSPVIDGATLGTTAISCGVGLGNKDPLAAADCASLVVDGAQKLTQQYVEVEQSILTKAEQMAAKETVSMAGTSQPTLLPTNQPASTPTSWPTITPQSPATTMPTSIPTSEPVNPPSSGGLTMLEAVEKGQSEVEKLLASGYKLGMVTAQSECNLDGMKFAGVNQQGKTCQWSFNLYQSSDIRIVLVSQEGVFVQFSTSQGLLGLQGYATSMPGREVLNSDGAYKRAIDLCGKLGNFGMPLMMNLGVDYNNQWVWNVSASGRGIVIFQATGGYDFSGGCE
jgi:hypothetical protein